MRYVDGFLLPLPKKSLQPHRKLLGGGRRLTHLKYRNVK
jgi:uncharacterized protein YbaA (DUF1428 family)